MYQIEGYMSNDAKKGLVMTFEYPPHRGGIGTFSYQMALNFTRLGIPIDVYATHHGDSSEKNNCFDQKQDFKVYRFRAYKNLLMKIVGRSNELISYCVRNDVKWIYVCTLRAGLIALICKKMFGVPYFIMGHGTEFARKTILKKLILKNASVCFANSNYTQNMMRRFDIKDVDVVCLGADNVLYDYKLVTEEMVNKIKDKYLLKGYPLILSVGRLNQRKGHDVTLKAISIIKKKYPDVKFVIIGNKVCGEDLYYDQLKDYVLRNSLQNNVCFVSDLSDEELRTFYSISDIFVLSSREYKGDVEGFGIVLIESNLMKTPVIGANTGGIADAIEDGKSGFLYENENYEELAAKIELLLENKSLYTEISEYGYTRAISEYTWFAVFAKIYKRIRESMIEER